ncbi:hypothetical protein HanPSC8_Chr02g0057701 [Helianthus annuus]|nr:hypothetical protein HanPSC8_Chr02g0057701 [Helianthus annuus]
MNFNKIQYNSKPKSAHNKQHGIRAGFRFVKPIRLSIFTWKSKSFSTVVFNCKTAKSNQNQFSVRLSCSSQQNQFQSVVQPFDPISSTSEKLVQSKIYFFSQSIARTLLKFKPFDPISSKIVSFKRWSNPLQPAEALFQSKKGNILFPIKKLLFPNQCLPFYKYAADKFARSYFCEFVIIVSKPISPLLDKYSAVGSDFAGVF